MLFSSCHIRKIYNRIWLLWFLYTNVQRCQHVNLQDCAQQVALIVMQLDDLFVRSNSGWFHPRIHTNCGLYIVGKMYLWRKHPLHCPWNWRLLCCVEIPSCSHTLWSLILGWKIVTFRIVLLKTWSYLGSTKRKLHLAPVANYDSHQHDKVNYSIPHCNTWAQKVTNRGILEFCKVWCVTHHIFVTNYMLCILLAHY